MMINTNGCKTLLSRIGKTLQQSNFINNTNNSSNKKSSNNETSENNPLSLIYNKDGTIMDDEYRYYYKLPSFKYSLQLAGL